MEDFLGGGYMICSTQLNNQKSICKRMAMEHIYDPFLHTTKPDFETTVNVAV